MAGVARTGRVTGTKPPAATSRRSGSWLDGPGVRSSNGSPAGAQEQTYPGEQLGLPASGPGSVAGLGRRVGALFVDWFVALLIAGLFTGRRPLSPGHSSLLTLAVFAVEYLVLVTSVGRTIGMRLLGIGVVRVGGGRLTLPWVVVRTVLLVLVVPAVVYDRDQRGLHDRASNAVAVRM